MLNKLEATEATTEEKPETAATAPAESTTETAASTTISEGNETIMKAIFTYTDIYGEHKESVNVAPVNDDFEIVEESDMYINLDDKTKSYLYSDLEFMG